MLVKYTMFALMVLKDLHRKYLNELGKIYPRGESERITQMIFEEMANVNRSDLIKDPALILSDTKFNILTDCLTRLTNCEPVQYVIGHEWFYKLKFKVTSAVLIPRPETEELVHEAISFLKTKQDSVILDIGSGSGCISVSLKKNLPQSSITSIDVSNDAMKISKENAALNNVSLDFRLLDFLEEDNWSSLNQYDAIISNPPYIPYKEKNRMDKNVVNYEPFVALFVEDSNPLIFYKKIAAFAKLHLKKEGKIFLETHEDFAMEVCALFFEEGYNALIKKDICEKDRMVIVSQYP